MDNARNVKFSWPLVHLYLLLCLAPVFIFMQAKDVSGAAVVNTGVWIASSPANDCSGPVDEQGRAWYLPEFIPADWQTVAIPDNGSITSGQDRYYRMEFDSRSGRAAKVDLRSDDGVWLYVNGQLVGHWGGDCHGAKTSGNVTVNIGHFLRDGVNVIAAHVTNGPGGSYFDLTLTELPQIILPTDSEVTVEFISTSTDCTGDFGIFSPVNSPIYSDYKYQQGVSFKLLDPIELGKELMFYLIPRSFCGSPTYLSTDPNRSRIERVNETTWRINWEDWTDADFNDLVVEITVRRSKVRFLDLPFDAAQYGGFIPAINDREQGGAVSSYFDHRYPTYSISPNSTYSGVVSFHGYDSVVDKPGFTLAYDGHDGIDFAVPGSQVTVTSAFTGIVVAIAPATPGSCQCKSKNPVKPYLIDETCLGNSVVITHPNGYTATYGHLASFGVINVGAEIGKGEPLGIMGSTGCSSGQHVHFQIDNPAGIAVDPFGWTPLPNSTYYVDRQDDPWRLYNQGLAHPTDATSYYLWLHRLNQSQISKKDQDTRVTSSSGNTVAVIPASAMSGPYRVELWESLNSAAIVDPAVSPLSTFAVFVFDSSEEPIWDLNQPMSVRYTLMQNLQASTASVLPPSEYRIYMWDDATQVWLALPTTYDPNIGTLSVSSTKLGRFAVAAIMYRQYIPYVSR